MLILKLLFVEEEETCFESPATPTQDEKFEEIDMKSAAINEDSTIPIFEISTTSEPVHQTRQHDLRGSSPTRATSPMSDVSDSKEPRASKRKRQDSIQRYKYVLVLKYSCINKFTGWLL